MRSDTEEPFDEEYYLAANPDVAFAIRTGNFFGSARDHYDRFGRSEGRPASLKADRRDAGAAALKAHRQETFRFLHGWGLEVGALDSPCPLPSACHVTYLDKFSVEGARAMFPELGRTALRAPDRIVDIDTDGLRAFADGSQDFAIFNQVIERVANPIAAIEELFRVTAPGGHVVIAVPDKRYTSDYARALTTWEHLLFEYQARVTQVATMHYLDLVALEHPQDILGGVDAIEDRIEMAKRRGERAHVWDSVSFPDFLFRCFSFLKIETRFVFQAAADDSRFEYFAILEKGG